MKTNLLKAVAVGLFASLIMYILMQLGIQTGIAPFNLPPAETFLRKLGFTYDGPLNLFVHYGYGVFWSIIFVYLLKDRINTWWGLVLGFALWILVMIVFSPIVGWGFFGLGDAEFHPGDSPFYLRPGPSYMIFTFVVHMLFGAITGWLNHIWIKWPKSERISYKY